MSEQMPRIWWSPGWGRFYTRDDIEIVFADDAAPSPINQFPNDAVELTVAAGDGVADEESTREVLQLLLAANAPGRIWDHYVQALLAGEDIDLSEIQTHVAADRTAQREADR